MFDNNIKIHFAGSDGEIIFHYALLAANVKYMLYSCYKYVVNADKDTDLLLAEDDIIKVQDRKMRHVIQDSGLFTLMFGAGKGQEITKERLIKWQDNLIRFVMANDLHATCVEIDCQKVLGVKEAWFFRERMKKLLPNRQINVFHLEDGKDGLDSLIDFSDYIAISVPELRIHKKGTYKQDTIRLAHYIKNRKPDIDIHLLGCTQFDILKDLTFCTSADSTSWLQGVKYGFISDGNQKKHVRQFDRNIFNQRRAQMLSLMGEREMKECTLAYTVNASISASIYKQRYTQVAGGQN